MEQAPRHQADYDFEREGVLFLGGDCDHGSVPEDTWQAQRSELMVKGGPGEDHLLPPHAILPETFNPIPEETPPGYRTEAANNPPPTEQEVLGRVNDPDRRYEILNRITGMQADLLDAEDEEEWLDRLYRYKRDCLLIAKDDFSIGTNVITGNEQNPKLAKGAKHKWVAEGLSFLPHTLAGVGNLCPYRSPACTLNCLNKSGHAELGETLERNFQIEARQRRSLLFYHYPDIFYMRLVVRITQRMNEVDVGRYAFRPNMLSDISWEDLKFFNPWARAEGTLIGSVETQFYDYTKNPARYQRFLFGDFPGNYHLTYSLSEVNALYAFYALAHGGSITVVFDAEPPTYGFRPRPAEPLPDTFCGYRVVDGDESDLRFLDREMFGIPAREGFVVGLRLKGRKHRQRHFDMKEKGVESGFIFDNGSEYDEESVIRRSEDARSQVRKLGDVPGYREKSFVGFPPDMVPMLTQWERGR